MQTGEHDCFMFPVHDGWDGSCRGAKLSTVCEP